MSTWRVYPALPPLRRVCRLPHLVVISLLSAALSSSAEPPTTAPADPLNAERQKNQLQYSREAADYPLLQPVELGQLLQFRIEKNRLAVYTRLPPTAGRSQVVVKDLPGICTIDVRSLGTDAPVPGEPYRPAMYLFERHDFLRPGVTDANTTVSITPMNIQVVQDVEMLGGGTRNVTLIQTSPAFLDPSEPAVRLRVAVSGGGDGDAAGEVKFTCAASDFVSLRRLYRSQTARYLEPIFRELHGEAQTFDADPRLAWEVFSAATQPDPAVTARVRELVGALDSDVYHTRESAAAELHRIGQPAAVALQHMDRTHCSPEQNSRIEAFLSEYHPVSDTEAARLRGDPDFLLDCLYLDDPFIVQTALDRLRSVTHRAVVFDTRLRDEPRRGAIAALRDGLSTLPTTAPAASPR